MTKVYDGELVDPVDHQRQQPRFSPLLEIAKGYLLAFWICTRPVRSAFRSLGLVGALATIAFIVTFCSHMIVPDPPAASIRDAGDATGAGAVAAEKVKPYVVQGARQVNSTIGGAGAPRQTTTTQPTGGRPADALSPQDQGTRR